MPLADHITVTALYNQLDLNLLSGFKQTGNFKVAYAKLQQGESNSNSSRISMSFGTGSMTHKTPTRNLMQRFNPLHLLIHR